MKSVTSVNTYLNKNYSKIRIGKHLSDTFPIQNNLNQEDALFPMLFIFASEYAIKNVQENQVRLKLNGAHLLLTCTIDVNLLADKINTIKKKLMGAKEEANLEAT
jgi:hypothetical protein